MEVNMLPASSSAQSYKSVKDEIESTFSLEMNGDAEGDDYMERSRKRRHHRKNKEKGGRQFTKLEDPNSPRKPRSAYVHFLSSRRSQYGTVKQGFDQREINIKLAKEWQELNTEQRQPFIDLAQKERTEYEKALDEYKKTDSFLVFQQKKDLVTRQRKQCKKMGVEPAGIEKILTEMEGVSGGGRGGKRKKVSNDFDYSFASGIMPTLENTDVPIFNEKFLEFNKEREAQLRQLRRAIGDQEDEQASIRKNMNLLQDNLQHKLMQQKDESKELAMAEATMALWTQILNNTIGQFVAASVLANPQSTVDFLTAFAAGKSTLNDDAQKNVRAALQSAAFTLPK